ncbi:MAG TPA: hypothetical protein VIF62_33825 [Labilithrix sp.]|jgi:hypothetical protein
MTAALTLADSSRPRWRVAELLLVGGATPILFALSWVLRRKLGLDDAELAVGFTFFYAAHLVNDPHFSVTYLLFYEDARRRAFGDAFSRAQRLRWLLAGVVAPVLLAAWSIGALAHRSAWSLGLLIQLMFLLVGWHYVKQGFGVMTVLAARRGVRFSPRERLAILAHCYAGWAYAWASPWDPGRELEEKGVVYTSIAQPRVLERFTFVLFALSLVPLAYILLKKRMREGSLPILTPLVALIASVWAWSIWSSVDPLVRYAIPALHSIQYLYMVSLLKRTQAREREGPPWFERAARVRVGILAVSALGLGWVLFHGAPTFLDDVLGSKRLAATPLGPTPWFAALYACVNIHHYVMDAVIWRRENPLTRYLVA